MPTVSICRWRNDAPFAYSMTCDEGTVDTMEYALPVHEQFGFPGHVDVLAGQLGLDLCREVVWSKYRLEDAIEHPVRIFTIPNDTHNYPPVIDLVREHYLACAYIEGGPNRENFDLYNIGSCMVPVGGFRARPGWPEEMKTENLSLDFVRDSWIYETSHLCMPDVPQQWKCVTPDYMKQ